MEQTKKKNLLLINSENFATDVELICKELKAPANTIYQLRKSSSSIYANIREAQYPQSRADMLSKFEISLKECNETEGWLQLLYNTNELNETTFKFLRNMCGRIKRMLISSCKTLKSSISPLPPSIILSYHNGEVPKGYRVRQVYGIIFTRDGRMMLKVDKDKNGDYVYSLAGGTPEGYDKDRIATLKRELLEEVNTTVLEPIIMVGYQTVTGDGDKPVYAQIRMTAMIDKVGEKLPDPDNGTTHLRLLAPPEKAKVLLNWTQVDDLINEAVRLAKENFDITFTNDKEEWV